MIQPIHILALSNRRFVTGQLRRLFCNGRCETRADSFWNGWGLDSAA